jgi:hypothetical protein
MSPAKIEREACLLGMRPQQQLEYLSLARHRVAGQRGSMPAQVAEPVCGR